MAAVGAVALLASGLRLLTGLYLHDPEAVTEYRSQADAASLAAGIARFGIRPYIAIVGRAYIRGRLAVEHGTRLLGPQVDALGGARHVVALRHEGVLLPSELEAAAAADVDAAASFDDLWMLYRGELPTLFAAVAFPADRLRRLVQEQYAAGGDGRRPFDEARRYGQWTAEHLGVELQFWRATLRASPDGARATFTELCGPPFNLRELHRHGLIDVGWARAKLDSEIATGGLSFWRLDASCDTAALVSSGLIDVRQLRKIFRDAIPVSSVNATVGDRRTHIVAFLQHVEPLLRGDRGLVPADMLPAVEAAWCDYTEAKRALDAGTQAAEQTLAAVQRAVRDAAAKATEGKAAAAARRRLEEAEAAHAAQMVRLKHEFAEAMIGIQQDFAIDVDTQRRRGTANRAIEAGCRVQ